jgi:hypothetical protein
MPECRNVGEKLLQHRHFFRWSAASVRHWHSGIRVQSGTAGHGLVRHCTALAIASIVIFLRVPGAKSYRVVLLLVVAPAPEAGVLVSKLSNLIPAQLS